MKRLLLAFGIIWVIFIGITFFSADDNITIFERLGYTAILAIIASLFCSGIAKSKTKKTSSSDDIKNCDIHYPLNPKVLYRIRDGKIFKGFDAAPTYEIKGSKIYPPLDPKPVYRIEGSKVYRTLEPAPILEIKGNKIYRPLGSKVIYEIRSPKA